MIIQKDDYRVIIFKLHKRVHRYFAWFDYVPGGKGSFSLQMLGNGDNTDTTRWDFDLVMEAEYLFYTVTRATS